MILDFQQPTIAGPGVVAFPDFPYTALPKQPSEIKETILLTGSSTGTTTRITGTADQQE